jgi:hypothetical protein
VLQIVSGNGKCVEERYVSDIREVGTKILTRIEARVEQDGQGQSLLDKMQDKMQHKLENSVLSKMAKLFQ